MPFIKLFVVFVASGLTILISLIVRVFIQYLWGLKFLSSAYLNFPLRLSNVIIPTSMLMSAVGHASINLNFPLRLSNVIIPPSLSAAGRASLSCRSSVYLFEFPAQIIERHYSSKFVSCRSSVAQLSV